MKLHGVTVSEQVYAAHERITQMDNDEFVEQAKKLDLDVGKGMPKYRGPNPYPWEGDYDSWGLPRHGQPTRNSKAR